MRASELRKAILQAAVQGKLLPQNVHDEPAPELLKRIQAEKAQHIKNGKFKKEKPMPLITEDEIPYDLPEGWVWCRLGNIIQLGENLNIHKELTAGTIINYVDIDAVDNLKYCIRNSKQEAVEKLSSRARRVLKKGYILYSLVRPYLNNIAIIEEDKENYIGSTGFIVFRPFFIPIGYFVAVLLSDYINNHFKSLLSGFNSPSVSQVDFLNTLFPLPPLAEQQRIVTKVDELMVLCNELEAAEQELVTLENRITEYLPKSILQAAVQGKLVSQNMNDEPATTLFERICDEKIRLVKEGKIREEKPLPSITEDEIPHYLPEGWVWCRLGDVAVINPRNNLPSDTNVSFVPMTSISNDYFGGHDQKVTVWDKVKSNFTHFAEGDVALAKITPCFQNGKSCLMSNLFNGYGAGTTELHIFRCIILIPKFLLIYLKTPKFLAEGVMNMTGTAGQQRVPTDYIKRCLFPLPPLAEQQRIVAKVDELMALCDELKNAKAQPIEKTDRDQQNIVDFPKTIPEEPLQLAARGGISKKPSSEFMQAIDDMFKGDV